MESVESKHSDHSFTAKLGSAVGVARPPLRLDSQAKYGEVTLDTMEVILDTVRSHWIL
jgi:hypothetical protein